jgi:MFS superfamily sulfate permease-like transporter
MKKKVRYYYLVWLKHDLTAGLSVFLVALPLSLGISLASGAPLYAGLLTGIIGGCVVSLISGAQLAVSGAAAGLTTLVSAAILSLGDYRVFLLTVIIAGLLQVVMGLLKLGIIADYFPSAVIKGMLAAIGIILISKQIPLAIGYDQPDFWRSEFGHLFSSGNFVAVFRDTTAHINDGVLVITILSIILYYVFQHSFLKRIKLLPVSLLIVAAGIGISFLLDRYNSPLTIRKSQFVSIPPNIFGRIQFPDFSRLFTSREIWRDGIMIGLLASLETLLCVEAIDKLDRQHRVTPLSRELIAQGIGNIVCGLLGALPMTAVIVRGAANVDAGARTKLSSVTHGIFLLLAVLLAVPLLNAIPIASLASILLITGFNLTKPKLYVAMWRLGWKQFLPFLITMVVILLTDLLDGVIIGLLISMYFIIQNNFKAEYRIEKTTHEGIETYYLRLNSNVTFLNKVKLKRALDLIPQYSMLTIDGTHCNFIDYDILEIISEFVNRAHSQHIQLALKGIETVNVTAIH